MGVLAISVSRREAGPHLLHSGQCAFPDPLSSKRALAILRSSSASCAKENAANATHARIKQKAVITTQVRIRLDRGLLSALSPTGNSSVSFRLACNLLIFVIGRVSQTLLLD
jgi:hypothetical protein